LRKGIAVLGIVAIIFGIVAVAGGGYYVYNHADILPLSLVPAQTSTITATGKYSYNTNPISNAYFSCSLTTGGTTGQCYHITPAIFSNVQEFSFSDMIRQIEISNLAVSSNDLCKSNNNPNAYFNVECWLPAINQYSNIGSNLQSYSKAIDCEKV